MTDQATKISRALVKLGRQDLAQQIVAVEGMDPEGYVGQKIKTARGILGEAQKALGRDDKKVWLAVASCVMELAGAVHELDQELADKVHRVGTEIMMKGKRG